MESIILIVISLIVSMLLKKKKQPEQGPVRRAQQVKPFTENPFKDLGDFAKDFMEEHKQQLDRKTPVVKKMPVVVEKVEREVSRNQGIPRSSGRLSTHQVNKLEKKVSNATTNHILPSSQEELVRAIVFSEILAPPKSKR
ncbi:hypothetical protein ACFVR1_11080 [Psychrobacillus sp. NPDC058041]|uniref:hypothetical protein n=1 Tax=Psychrobacillus sp. NPDC058041 TaxID=3346310 RepID=UPI0036DCAC12